MVNIRVEHFFNKIYFIFLAHIYFYFSFKRFLFFGTLCIKNLNYYLL